VEVRCHLCQATNPPGAGWCNQCGARFLDALLVGVVAGVVGGLLGLPDNVGRLLTLVAMIGYETLMLANGGQTLGKMLLGLRVVRTDLAPPAVQDGLVRSLVIDLLGIVPLAWLVLAVVIERHPRRQGWHDRAAGTLVVRSRA
jgi:uncharacterized RDD family membrane protein YckC